MSKQARLSQTPPDVAHSRARSRSMSSTPPLALATAVDSPVSQLETIPEPPDTPPPLEQAYTAQTASGHSSQRSTPELVYASSYPHHNAVLHPSSRVSESPELPYTAAHLHPSSQWSHADATAQRYGAVKTSVDTSYGYERDQPPSPTSSVDSQYATQSQPVSPQSPYTFGQYGSSSQAMKYESSPGE
jgi:hypothetical protein